RVIAAHVRGAGGPPPATRLQPLANQGFDARIDVRAVEGGDSRGHETIHVVPRGGGVDGTVTSGQLPPALQQTRDAVTGSKLHAREIHDQPGGSGTAVTSRWRN